MARRLVVLSVVLHGLVLGLLAWSPWQEPDTDRAKAAAPTATLQAESAAALR